MTNSSSRVITNAIWSSIKVDLYESGMAPMLWGPELGFSLPQRNHFQSGSLLWGWLWCWCWWWRCWCWGWWWKWEEEDAEPNHAMLLIMIIWWEYDYDAEECDPMMISRSCLPVSGGSTLTASPRKAFMLSMRSSSSPSHHHYITGAAHFTYKTFLPTIPFTYQVVGKRVVGHRHHRHVSYV